jgi:uncharacterized protein (TIGR02246 family)
LFVWGVDGILSKMAEKHTTIESLMKSYEAALNASDSAAVMDLYGMNPIFVPQNAPAMVGRDAIKKAYDLVFSTIKLNVRFTVHEVETLGDTAWGRTSSAGRQRNQRG